MLIILKPVSVAIVLFIIFCAVILYLAYKSIKHINEHLIYTVDSMTRVLNESQKNLINTNKLLKGINEDNKQLQPSIKAISKVSNNISSVSDNVQKIGSDCKVNGKKVWNKIKRAIK